MPAMRTAHALRNGRPRRKQIRTNPFSLSIYGEPSAEIDDLLPSIREHGILVALVVAPGPKPGTWEVLSGHRRLACALALGLSRGSLRGPPAPAEVMRDGGRSWNTTASDVRHSVN